MRVTWPDGRVTVVPPVKGALDAALARFQAMASDDVMSGAVPCLYDAAREGRVVYQREPVGVETWQLPSQTLGAGHGDCEDLAVWRASEVPGARAVAQHIRGGQWHAVVQHADGRIEDPTRVLKSMGASVAGEMGAEEVGMRRNANAVITWSAQPSEQVRGGWRGVVRVQMADGGEHVVQRGGRSRSHAISRAMSSATRLLDSPLARSLLPPQAALALQLFRSPVGRAVTGGIRRLFHF